jgi:2-methylcitrate dehydratase PrpD
VNAGLSRALATHVVQADYASLSPTTIWATKRAILDGIGVMLAASGSSSDILPFVELARCYQGGPKARILGFEEPTSAPWSAFANGAMAHALDFEDAFDACPLHPNASLLPSALAVAWGAGAVSGKDFIAAVATGCDLVCRMGLALRRPMEAGGWYPPPILGAFGAAAACAKLLKLDAQQTCDAWSLLMCQNSCPGEIKYSPDTVIRAVREAFPAQAAVISVQLAARGVRGFEQPLEGKSGFYALFAAGQYDPNDILGTLGRSNWIEQLSFKQWPCCRGTHAYIEAAQLLHRMHEFDCADIDEILIVGGDAQRMLCEPVAQKRRPRTIIDAKFSLPFTIASAMVDAEVTLGSFTSATLLDERRLAVAATADFREAGPSGRGAASADLTIVLKDGRRLRHTVENALGDPSRPLSDDTLHRKFVDCAGRAVVPRPCDEASVLAERIMALEHETDVGAVLMRAI